MNENGIKYIKVIPIRAIKIETQEHIDRAIERANNPQDAVMGNYLITGHRGCNYIVNGEIFEEMYAPYQENQ